MAKYVDIEESGKVWLLDKNYDTKTDTSTEYIPMEILNQTWDNLRFDFLNMLGSESMTDSLRLKAEYLLHYTKYDMVVNILDILEKRYSQKLADTLLEFGYRVKYSEDAEEYQKSIKTVRSKAKTILFNANVAKTKMEELMENQKKKAKSEDDGNIWLNILIGLGTANNVYYEADKINCYDFLQLYKSAIRRSEKEKSVNAQKQ